MILKYFSKYLTENNLQASLPILFFWLKLKIETPAACHEDKIIQSEIYLGKNRRADFCLIGKSTTGRNLIKSLYNYVLGCGNLQTSRDKHNKK